MNLLVAVPTHSQSIEAETLLTLLGCQRVAAERGWRFQVAFYSGPDLDEIRNRIAGDVLERRIDAVLMLDGDQAMEPELLLRMADSGHLVVGAMYPRRGYNWTSLREGPPATSLPELLARATRHVGTIKGAGSAQTEVEVRRGLAPAAQLGGGCWLIRREAFERLKTACPELRGRGSPEPDPAAGGDWAFFTTLPAPETGEPLTEDFAFCHRWSLCGGELWIDLASPVTHIGRHLHRGAFVDHLAAYPRVVDGGA